MKGFTGFLVLAFVGIAAADFWGGFRTTTTTTRKPIVTTRPTLPPTRPTSPAPTRPTITSQVSTQVIKKDSLDTVKDKFGDVSNDLKGKYANLKKKFNLQFPDFGKTMNDLKGTINDGMGIAKQSINEQLKKHPEISDALNKVESKVSAGAAELKKQYDQYVAPVVGETVADAKDKLSSIKKTVDNKMPEIKHQMDSFGSSIKDAINGVVQKF